MRILIADDEPVTRHLVEAKVASWGHEVVICENGRAALAEFEHDEPPSMAILDWVMPDVTGVDICRTLRQGPTTSTPVYLILLTANAARDDVIEGLEAGADGYIVKPFHPEDLRVRLEVGIWIVALQQVLAQRVDVLETALSRVKQLQGLLPIFAYCKKVRDDQNYWSQVDSYLARHSNLRFSHGICPDYYAKVVDSQFDEPV
ncbi:MAG: response regulator transcription factor [Vicinamibacterales bacterium]|jgi:DNA-binding response OmpR family regulator|nr:response regulator [Acidobacteriota bacterium]MDP7472908.1 response regulator transcription factor [Vicinamibacterales bacterium]MDP7671471.1 response regulator transcription factor [Vicinamibacterales bacterium]HJO38945.1 response regulator transcription factor [Vicinamibacterales bacterium]